MSTIATIIIANTELLLRTRWYTKLLYVLFNLNFEVGKVVIR